MDQLLYSAKDVAKMLGVSYTKVLALRKSGLPCVKMGRKLKFRKESVETHLKSLEK